MRKPNTEVETYELGHWEAMQLSIALDRLADSMNEADDLGSKLHTRDLGRIFSTGDATFSVVKRHVEP